MTSKSPGRAARRPPIGRWLVALCLLSCGCGAEREPEPEPEAAVATSNLTSGAVCVPGEGLDYESFGRDFIARYCLGCHTRAATGPTRMAPPGRDFDDLASIQQLAFLIDQQAAAGPAADRRVMPPLEPKPSPAEREQLGRWLACGAPARAGDVPGAAAPTAPPASCQRPATAGQPSSGDSICAQK